MIRFGRRFDVLLLLVLLVTSGTPTSGAEESEKFPAADLHFFETSVRPILAGRCFKCHADKKQEASLRLDSRAAILRGADTGMVVQIGKPKNSSLIKAIEYQGDVRMPPDDKLPKQEIDILRQWIQKGIPWPKPSSPSENQDSVSSLFAKASKEHWAFQPIRLPSLPAVVDSRWPSAPLDEFVLARLEPQGLTPSTRADRRNLIRRASFDLLGLPPTPEQVAAFVQDQSPDAYAKLVDSLLASPQYGERWGRHWLDVARYADTRGYAFGRERRFPYAYTYRDYVIRAMNQDLPYDRFILEQLAADRLSLSEDKRPLAALGFLTVGRRYNNRHDDIDDRIDVVGRGLLGLTIGCARCHDHKFDPIPSEDYYSLYGVFAGSVEPKELTVIGSSTDVSAYKKYQEELAELQQEMDDFSTKQHSELLDAERRRTTDYLLRVVMDETDKSLKDLSFVSLGRGELRPRLIERWRKYLKTKATDDPVFGPWRRLIDLPQDQFAAQAEGIIATFAEDTKTVAQVKAAIQAKPPQTKAELVQIYGKLLQKIYLNRDEETSDEGVQSLQAVVFDENSPSAIPLKDVFQYLDREKRNKHRELQRQIEHHNVRSPGAPPRAMMLVDAAKPYQARVFIRGDHHRPGKQVPRQFLAILSGEDRQPFADGSGRLDLAKAIVSKDNPLTARVLVNRVWMHHFGAPLVRTPSDFGLQSDPPTHPQVLDYLAWNLREQGWSLKWLHRTIMLSSTYQQASLDRPECKDKDPENRLLWKANRRRLELEPMRDALLSVAGRLDLRQAGRPVDLLKQPYTNRRSVYGFIDRQDLPGLFRVFDFASPDQTTPQRPQTTVPQQALYLMNSAFAAEQANYLAGRRELTAIEDPQERIKMMYRIVFGRSAGPEEIKPALEFIESSEKEHAWQRYAQTLLLTNEFIFID